MTVAVLETIISTLPTSTLAYLAPFRNSGNYFPVPDLLKILQAYEKLSAPVSMRVATTASLYAHMALARTIAEAHDELARREGWEKFPNRYCTTASTGVMLSLIAHGYPNALVLSALPPREHSYVGLPYVLGEEKGVILIDPTVGQMEGHAQSVLVERKLGEKWEYRPGWGNGIDLYPDGALDHEHERRHANSGRTTALMIKVHPLAFVKTKYHDAPTYFHQAFDNPVDVGIPAKVGEILKNIVA